MRWDELFADLEGQLAATEVADLEAEIADRTRAEVARMRLVDRLRAASGHRLSVVLPARQLLSGRLAGVGPDWLLLTETPDREALVPLAVVLSVTGLGRRSAAPGSEGAVASRLGLTWALRGLARDRSPVTLGLVDGSSWAGTLDRVGADFVELAEHAPGEPRRPAGVSGIRAVPLAALAVVRRS